MLYYTILYDTIISYNILYYIILYYTMLVAYKSRLKRVLASSNPFEPTF